MLPLLVGLSGACALIAAAVWLAGWAIEKGRPPYRMCCPVCDKPTVAWSLDEMERKIAGHTCPPLDQRYWLPGHWDDLSVQEDR